jgi:hypothetical protein
VRISRGPFRCSFLLFIGAYRIKSAAETKAKTADHQWDDFMLLAPQSQFCFFTYPPSHLPTQLI